MAQDKRELGDQTTATSGLTVKVDADVSEAIRGLKAVQREAKKATQALAELKALQESMRDE